MDPSAWHEQVSGSAQFSKYSVVVKFGFGNVILIREPDDKTSGRGKKCANIGGMCVCHVKRDRKEGQREGELAHRDMIRRVSGMVGFNAPKPNAHRTSIRSVLIVRACTCMHTQLENSEIC